MSRGLVNSRAPIMPAIAISATATSTPPSDTSWQARTSPARICVADEIAVGAFGGQIDGGRRAFLAAGDLAQPQRLAEPALGGADQHDVEPGRQRDARPRLRRIVQHAEAADRRRRQDRARPSVSL